MGSFDSFWFKTICPWCEKEDKFEAQTKDLTCGYNSYSIGKKVKTHENFIIDGDLTLKGLLAYHKCGPIEDTDCFVCSSRCERQEERCFTVDISIKNGIFKGVKIGRKIDLKKERLKNKKKMDKLFGCLYCGGKNNKHKRTCPEFCG